MDDSHDVFEMVVASLPVGLLLLTGGVWTRFVLIDANLLLLVGTVVILVSAVVLSIYIAVYRALEEYEVMM